MGGLDRLFLLYCGGIFIDSQGRFCQQHFSFVEFFFFTVFLNKRLSLLDAFHLLNATRLGSWAPLRSFTGTELVFLLTTTPRGGGVFAKSLGGEVRPGPSYPDPV